MKIHIVQKGDTLWKIAKKYGVNFEELKKMNTQLSNPDMIMPGMKIKVPTAGGTIKKESPYGGSPATKINMGTKKEMPMAQQPIFKEKPIAKEQPIVKEKPIVKEQPIVKKQPIAKEQPIVKEAPIKEAPIKEMPKTPYIPKMPEKVIPEIDINNYYMMNMANMQIQPPPPKLPPAPVNILPQVKEEPKKEEPKKEEPKKEEPIKQMPMEMPLQGGCPPPMYQYPYCYPISPVLPGSGLHCPPGYQHYYPQHGGMMMPGQMGQMPNMGLMPDMGQMPNMGQMPGMGQMPDMGQMPPMGQMPLMDDDDESPFMPQMPNQGMAPIAGMGNEPFPQQMPMQMPNAPMQMPNAPMQMPNAPMQMPYGCPPLGVPCSPVLPGSGMHHYGGFPMGQNPQVLGAMDFPQVPNENAGMMPYQQMPMQEQAPPPFAGTSDCGCGGPEPFPPAAPFQGGGQFPQGAPFQGGGQFPQGAPFQGGGQFPQGAPFQGGGQFPQGAPFQGGGQFPQGAPFQGGGQFPQEAPFQQGGPQYHQGLDQFEGPGGFPQGPGSNQFGAPQFQQGNQPFREENPRRNGGPTIFKPPYGQQGLYVNPFGYEDMDRNRDESSEYER